MMLAQESKNNLAPITMKLGKYSKWNHSRDFANSVKLPVEGGSKKDSRFNFKHFRVDCGIHTPERTLFMRNALFFLGESHPEHGDSSKFPCTIRTHFWSTYSMSVV